MFYLLHATPAATHFSATQSHASVSINSHQSMLKEHQPDMLQQQLVLSRQSYKSIMQVETGTHGE